MSRLPLTEKPFVSGDDLTRGIDSASARAPPSASRRVNVRLPPGLRSIVTLLTQAFDRGVRLQVGLFGGSPSVETFELRRWVVSSARSLRSLFRDRTSSPSGFTEPFPGAPLDASSGAYPHLREHSIARSRRNSPPVASTLGPAVPAQFALLRTPWTTKFELFGPFQE